VIEIRYEINGRRIDPRNVRDAIESAVLGAVSDSISQKLRSCRCPDHGGTPKLIGKGRSVDKLNFEISGCCDNLIAEVKRRLA
jgi:hypothetical protein